MGWASVNGRIVPLEHAVVSVQDTGFTLGWTVFETALIAEDGSVPLLAEHLERLRASARAAEVSWPGDETLMAGAVAVAARLGALGRLRITLTGSGGVVIVAEVLPPDRRGRPVRCVRGIHRDDPVLGGAVKHGSRLPWVVAVRRSGVDDVLLVDGMGRFTEGTTCGILAVIDGVVWTAPHDGAILASTTVLALLAGAERLGFPVRRERPPAHGPWQGLYVASATRGLAPVVELDGEALPGWEPLGQSLAEEIA